MTAQFQDIIRYQGEDYNLVGMSEEGLFEPEQYGMQPVSTCTACWRGYIAIYAVDDRKLLLSELLVNLNPFDEKAPNASAAPLLNNVDPVKMTDEHGLFEYDYRNINLPLPYTGGLLIAIGFIDELYVHMGFHPAWKYKQVHELIFEDGQLVSEADVSKKMKDVREKMKTVQARPERENAEDIMAWIKKCFSRKYT